MEFTYKQAIVIRVDLKMSVGKIAAQAAHAAVSAAEECRRIKPEWFRGWLEEGQKKVVLKVSGLEELKQLHEQANSLGLPTSMIEDAGLTEVPAGTITALGIGPAPSELIDRITGKLKLL
ncbi:MAG: peptidyl-tRNA hydrolase [Thaumarchaeota archaeon]|nr:MAG: peptidyl-tRNA hydrolase [Nitrososphaerota archaeon]